MNKTKHGKFSSMHCAVRQLIHSLMRDTTLCASSNNASSGPETVTVLTRAWTIVCNSTNSDCKLCSLESQLFSYRGSFARWECTGELLLLANLDTSWLGDWAVA